MKSFIIALILLSFYGLQAQDIEAIVTSPLCEGDETGSIDITFDQGIPPYMYLWSNGAITEDIDLLIESYYTLTITDSQDVNFVGQWDVFGPIPIEIIEYVMNPTCNTNNEWSELGAIEINAIGGTEDFTFVWDGPGVEGSNETYLSELGVGTYSLTVTDTNGCSESSTFNITEPDEIIVDATIQNLDCVDGQSQLGSIEVDVNGGFPPYTFYWNGSFADQFAQSQYDLVAGYYSLEIIDANGCMVFEEFDLTGAEPLEVQVFTQDATCSGGAISFGAIELLVTGGVAPYVYSWIGEGLDPTADGQGDLNVGVYSVTVSDSQGCQMQELDIEINSQTIGAPSLCLITNDNPNGYNTLYWEDPADLTGVEQYNIYREGSSVSQFDPIGELVFGPENMFFDTEANSVQQAYRYYVTSANSCGFESEPSATHKTIHLTINQGSLGNMNLIWDEYEGLEYNQVVIYRGDTPSTLDIYETLPGNLFSYTDSDALDGDAYYQIVITTSVECNTNHALYQLKSNVAGFFVNSIEDFDWLTEVYPNPFDDQISMVLKSKAKAQLIDANGRLISEYEMVEGVNSIPTDQLEKGIYMVRLVSNNEVAVWKGIKAN